MKKFTKIIKKTLLYNLIIFDFILLESSISKISNFFIEKFDNILLSSNSFLKKKFLRVSLTETVKSFKRYIRLFYFLKKKRNKKIITIFSSDSNLELLKLLFKQYKLTSFFYLNSTNSILYSFKFLKSLLFLEQPFNKSNFLSFFFKNFFLLQTINSLEDNLHYNTYKIFASLDDYKKIIFIGLILISIFKK
jgi:hypothetical protein